MLKSSVFVVTNPHQYIFKENKNEKEIFLKINPISSASKSERHPTHRQIENEMRSKKVVEIRRKKKNKQIKKNVKKRVENKR